MNTDIIRTPADRAAALAEIDRMGEPEIGTADFKRLDGLATQVEEYEDEHSPMGTPTAEAVAEYEAEKRDADRATSLTAAEHAEYTRLLSEMGILADLEILDERERQAELERGVAATTEQSTYTWDCTPNVVRLYRRDEGDDGGHSEDHVGKVMDHVGKVMGPDRFTPYIRWCLPHTGETLDDIRVHRGYDDMGAATRDCLRAAIESFGEAAEAGTEHV